MGMTPVKNIYNLYNDMVGLILKLYRLRLNDL